MRTQDKQRLGQLRRWRIRKKVRGSKERPRMAVCFANKNIHVQFIDDDAGATLATASTLGKNTPDRDKLAATISAVLAKSLAAKPASATWSPVTGKLKLTFKRPSQIVPALELTDTIEMIGLVASDAPGGSDRLMLWIGSPATTTSDETSGAKLILSDDSSNDEETDQRDDGGLLDALAKELKGQRWDSDKSAWK